MTAVFVISDQPGAGKTAICASLSVELGSRDIRSTVVKPLTTSPAPDADKDTEIYHSLLGLKVNRWPSVLSTDGLTEKTLNNVKAAFTDASRNNDIVLVEGDSRLSSDHVLNIADAIDAAMLLVIRYRGDIDINDAERWRSTYGKRLAGCVFNFVGRYQGIMAQSTIKPMLESVGIKVFGIIPEDRSLLAVSIEQLSIHLGGQFIIGETLKERLVEAVLIGGMSMDRGDLYFGIKTNKAVVVRGDRPDIQMAALQTPTACLVLTGGIGPTEYVRHEAECVKVPVIVVKQDTLSTMEALNALMLKANFNHRDKLYRFRELLRQNVDIDAILGATKATQKSV